MLSAYRLNMSKLRGTSKHPLSMSRMYLERSPGSCLGLRKEMNTLAKVVRTAMAGKGFPSAEINADVSRVPCKCASLLADVCGRAAVSAWTWKDA